MYVSKHVCMFETVNHHPRAGCDSSRKTFSIERFIQFFEICEGGYFWRPQTSMYVCLRCLSMYVCLQACMYVWDRKSSSQGWVRFLTENLQYWTFYSIFWDLWGGVLPEALTYIHAQHTYIHAQCFKNPLPVEGFSKALSLWRGSDCEACVYVCMLSMYVCMLGHLEVPPLTNLKKLNYRSNTERFS